MAGGLQVEQQLPNLQPALNGKHPADGTAVTDEPGQHLAIDAGRDHAKPSQLCIDLPGGQRQRIGLALTLAV